MNSKINKKTIKTINDAYIHKYGLPQGYRGKLIVLYDDRYMHFAKHKDEFTNIEAYQKSILSIDKIINDPDFISFNDKNNSLEFVKKIDDDTLIAVRASSSNELKIKTLFPISATKKSRLKEKAFKTYVV